MTLYDILKNMSEAERSILLMGVVLRKQQLKDTGMDNKLALIKSMEFVEEYLECRDGFNAAMDMKEMLDGLKS